MKRLNKNQRDSIKNLALEGFSLNRISKELNLPKTTVYYWFRKVVGRKIKPIVINRDSKEKIGEIIGVFAGDGSFTYVPKQWEYVIRFFMGNCEESHLKWFIKILENVFSKRPYVYCDNGQYVIGLRSKKISKFLKEYLAWEVHNKTNSIKLKKDPTNFSVEFLKGFLRGLIDSDGYIHPRFRSISFATTSPELHKQTKNILDIFGIKYSQRINQIKHWSPLYVIQVWSDDASKLYFLVKPKKKEEAVKDLYLKDAPAGIRTRNLILSTH